ncbi:hypothetical protein [Candidatus Nitrosocosmicus sp. FF01]|uniref:hypothetical protein n=1 Tax=Candidatus Nitrosocosmicus sp. FF01 TaxID=3397670 RepID=UPI0039EC105E
MTLNPNMENILQISCIVFSLLIIAQISIVEPANALTRYFNCVTRAANHNGTFSMENAEVCYDKVFKGAADNDEFGRVIN